MGDGLCLDEGPSTVAYKVSCIVLHSYEKTDFIRSGIRTWLLVKIKYRNLASGERSVI